MKVPATGQLGQGHFGDGEHRNSRGSSLLFRVEAFPGEIAMRVINAAKIKKIDNSRRLAAAIESCIQRLEQRVMMSSNPTIGSVTASPSTDPVGQVTILTAVNVAPATGESIANVQFYAEKTAGTMNPATDYNLGAGTANGSSYTLAFTPSSVPFAAGNYTVYPLATDAVSGLTSNEPTVTLNVTTPTLNFSAPAFYTGTVPSGGENLTITVTRSSDTADPVSVNYATSNGTSNANAIDTTAAAGTDYTATSGTLNFAANQTSGSFTVNIPQSNTGVGDKVFTVTLSNPSIGTIGTFTGTTAGTAAVLIDQTPRAFAAGDAVVEVGGNGATPVQTANGTNSVYLYEYNSTGGLVQAFPLPNAQTNPQSPSLTGVNRPLMAGDSGFEALIGNSLDGQNLLLGGYDSTTSFDYSFGFVDSNGDIDTTTGINSSTSLSVPRGLATSNDSNGGTLYWLSSSGVTGLQQINRGTVGTAANAVNTLIGTPRALVMDANGDLFEDTTTASVNSYLGYVPTSQVSPTELPGITSGNAGACTQFGFASNISEDDTLYLENGSGNTADSGIEKFSLTGTNSTAQDGYAAGSLVTLAEQITEIQDGQSVRGTWVLESTSLLPTNNVVNPEGLGLTVDQTSPTNVQIYDTLAPFSITGPNAQGSTTKSLLFSLTDTLNLTSATPATGTVSQIATLPGNNGVGGYNGSGGSTTVSTAQFHCVANAPVAAGLIETTTPQSQTVSNGQTVTFSAWAGQQNVPSTALGTSVQWYEIPPGGGTPITLTGQNWTTLEVTATDALNGAQYYAVFSNSNTGASDGSEYVATLTVNDTPYVTGVSPNAGPLQGGVSVTLTGGDFAAGSTVSFQGISGAITPTSIAPNGSSLTFVAPPEGPGTYDVRVTDSNGTSPATASETFTYLSGPTVTSISPNTGPDGGGTTITINGTGFVTGATVTFGGIAATDVTFVNSTELTAVTPAAAAPATTVDTIVTETVSGTSLPSATSSADKFTYARFTVAEADELAETSSTGPSVLIDNFPIVTAITQHIGTFGNESYGDEEFLLDDGTASIMAFATAAQLGSYTPTVGDELQIAGQVTSGSFPLLPQLYNITSITLLASAQPIPSNFDPTVTVSQISGNPVSLPYLSQEVTLTGATIDNIPATGAIFGVAGTGNLFISDPTDPYIPQNGSTPASGGVEFDYDPGHIGISEENLDGLPVPTGDDVTVTGIIQNFYGTIEFCPISIPGNSERFSFNMSQGTNPLPSDATTNPNATLGGITNLNITDGFATLNRGGSITLTVTRLESVPAGGSPDTGTVDVLLTADTGVAGTDFSVAGYTPSNGVITIPVTFNPGQSTATFTVTTNSASSSGSKLFTVSLANPVSSNPGGPSNPLGFDVSVTTNPQTVVIEDTSANEVDAFASISSGALQSELDNIEAGQFSGDGALDVESTSQGIYADYGIMTFDDSAFDPTDILNRPGNTVETINGLQFEAIPSRSDFDTAGTLNVYIITNTSYTLGNNQGGTYPVSGLSFNPDYTNGIGVADPTTGIISDIPGLGTLYPLGSIAYDPTKVLYGAENVFNLSTLNPIGTQLLALDISQESPITIVIAPGDSDVAATFAGFVTGPLVQQTEPNLRIQYSTALPTWVTTPNGDANSQTVFITPTNTLAVTGAATITGNPTSPGLPNVTVTGPTANLNISSSSPTGMSLGSLSLSNGANATIATLSSPQVLFIAAGNPSFSIDSTSTLDIGNNIVDLQNGSGSPTDASLLSTVSSEVALGFNNGLWTGTGGAINSSAAAADHSYLSAVGVALGSQSGSATLDGQTPGAFDVLIRETYYGDANVDGKVDASDYSRIDNGYLNQLTGWANGDFNYDGVVNGSDYTLIDNVFNRQGMPFATPAAQITTPAAKSGRSSAVPATPAAVASLFAASTTSGTSSSILQSSATSGSIEDLLMQDSSIVLLAKDVLDNLQNG